MSQIAQLLECYPFFRGRTVGLLDAIAKEPDPQAVLGFRPGPGRAHIGWQLMHIGVTEDLFASERLGLGKAGKYPHLWARFRGGSTPDDEIPSVDLIREVLTSSREHLLATFAEYDDSRLGEVPEALKARNLTIKDVLHLLPWHEAHHQGQAHITLNIFRATR